MQSEWGLPFWFCRALIGRSVLHYDNQSQGMGRWAFAFLSNLSITDSITFRKVRASCSTGVQREKGISNVLAV